MPKKPSAKNPVPLEKYRQKRDFRATPEPSPDSQGKAAGRAFVIQEHHARSHHFDLRLEMDGVLTSWAVPKGVPEDTQAKRLAVHVEDHPLSYATFEGEIPKGNYGAGTVSIWDDGQWEPLEEKWETTFKKGELKFILHGRRLEGPYLLARMKEEPNWLLRKLNPATHPSSTGPPTEKGEADFVEPQLARPVPSVPSGNEWIHEIKYDGYRLIAVRKEGDVRLFTRNKKDWTDRFEGIAEALRELDGGDFVMDGEAVVFDSKGQTQFGELQDALKSSRSKKISYVVFDLLNAEGQNLRRLPCSQRIARLNEYVPEDSNVIRRSKIWTSDEGPELFRQSCELGLEGIISKRSFSPYHPGSRKDWTKSKCRPRQEFVIVGYTPPQGSCSAFGALVLASYENGKLISRGRVGTGFSDSKRRSLLKELTERKISKPHFPAMKEVNWVKPELIAEIEFTEITREGSIRQGSFISLREDKQLEEVHLDPVTRATLDSGGSTVMGIEITHPDRIVFPDDGVTKLEVARYFERVGEFILPHLIDRPLALLRAPEGIAGDMFFQKSFKGHVPPHVQVRTLDDGSEILYIKSIKGLISLVQYGAIEFHPWGSSLPKVDKPDLLIWDLDPDKAVPWREILGAAFLLRDSLAELGLETQVKTSGGKGLHVMLPLKRLHSWEVMKPFAKAVAASVAAQNPGRFTINSSLRKRTGKIYIDWMRNGRGSTCIVAWGLRARPGATVSMPINWDDLPQLAPQGFNLREPSAVPSDWQSITPQSVKKAVIEEMIGVV